MSEDLVSRQAAIDAIRAFYDEYIVYDNGKSIEDLISELPSAQRYTDEEIQKMQDLEQAMISKAFQLGQQDAQQWIPVTERLPEPYCGDVLVTVNDGSVYVDVMAYDSPGDGHTYNGVFYTTDSDGYPNICEDVVAWMPLPKPWEGGEA